MFSSTIKIFLAFFSSRFCLIYAPLMTQYARTIPNYGGAKYGCSIVLNRDLLKPNRPLYVKKHGSSYAITEPKMNNRDESVIEMNSKEELILACPGQKNYLVEAKQPLLTGYCVHDTTFSTNASAIATSTFTAEDVVCATPVQADIKATNIRCAQFGKIYEIGFEKAQETLFKKVLGRGKLKRYYDDKSDLFFSRGHLAPGGDFIFSSEQFATYFYVNVAPQWQIINNGNWQTVEKMVRKHAKNIQEELDVLTGTYGILELEDEKGKPQQLYLNHQKKNIPVPAYFWKVVYNPRTKESIVFVTSNNPHQRANDPKIPFCEDSCLDYDWMWWDSNSEFDDVKRGITSCCSFHKLRRAIPQLPSLDVHGVMRGNRSF